MLTDQLVDQLARDLKPVRRRRPWVDALIMALIFGCELAAFLEFGELRPDMWTAMRLMAFWWKLASLSVIAAVAGGAAILSFDPAASPRRVLRWVPALVAVSLAVGWGIDATTDGWPAVAARLQWRDGVDCASTIVLLALPAVIGLGFLMSRGAPTDIAASASAVGVASGALGAFVFVFSCAYDDPLYIAVWYGLGCGLTILLARLLLPRLTRW
jgi:hypothetical protein